MINRQDEVKKKACELCAVNNGSGCTTPQPDPGHWICKAWLKKAESLTAPEQEEELREKIASLYNREVTGALDAREFANPQKFAKAVMLMVKEAGWKSPEEVLVKIGEVAKELGLHRDVQVAEAVKQERERIQEVLLNEFAVYFSPAKKERWNKTWDSLKEDLSQGKGTPEEVANLQKQNHILGQYNVELEKQVAEAVKQERKE